MLAPFDDDQLRRQVSPLMSPLCWDLAHIGHYEELWLLRQLLGEAPTDERYDDLYDAFRHPRRERAGLPILDPDGARAYVADVRARVLDSLDRGGADGELGRDAFVYGMVVQHEHQHQETMLATIGLMDRPYPVPGNGARRHGAAPIGAREVRLPGAARRDGHRRRAVGVRQRAARTRGRRGAVPHRRDPGDERGISGLRRR